MDQDELGEMVAGLRDLYEREPAARAVFDWAAGQRRDSAVTNIELIEDATDISHPDAVKFARDIELLECGRFIIGRRGAKSRIIWNYGLKSLGKVAQDQSDVLHPLETDPTEAVTDQRPPASLPAVPSKSRLTLIEAKRQLAAAFGVSPDAIEITIRG